MQNGTDCIGKIVTVLGQDPSQIDASYSPSTDAITIDAFGIELEFNKKQCGKVTSTSA